jgi:uncharacterized membrane protein YbhN (UPF0104 family)
MRLVQGKKAVLSRVAGVAIVLVIFGFLFRSLYLEWEQVVAYGWDLNWAALALAFTLMLSASALYAYLWKVILDRLGTPLSYRKSYRIFFISQLGRYIPGKVWSILGLVYLSQKEGVSKIISGASVTLQLLLQIVSGVIVFALALPFWKGLESSVGLLALIVCVPVGLVLLHPALVTRGVNLALRLTDQPETELSWSYSYLLGQLALWVGFWLWNGVAYHFLIRSLDSSPLPNAVVLAGVFSIAWVAGFLSLVTPSGLGIMEGALTFLLSFYFPVHVATIIALWTRVARTASDLVCAAIAWRL